MPCCPAGVARLRANTINCNIDKIHERHASLTGSRAIEEAPPRLSPHPPHTTLTLCQPKRERSVESGEWSGGRGTGLQLLRPLHSLDRPHFMGRGGVQVGVPESVTCAYRHERRPLGLSVCFRFWFRFRFRFWFWLRFRRFGEVACLRKWRSKLNFVY